MNSFLFRDLLFNKQFKKLFCNTLINEFGFYFQEFPTTGLLIYKFHSVRPIFIIIIKSTKQKIKIITK